MIKRLAVLLAFVMTFSAPVMAQDFQKGLAAYNTDDYATALQEWTPLAEAGDAAAQWALGAMYDNGDGLSQDYAEAMKWFRLAAEQGFSNAQQNLGAMYRDGKGVPQDYAEAMKWFRLAAEQGSASAQSNLGFMYEGGRGVLQDNATAHMWYNIGAANGNELGGTNRDKIAKRMTPAAIEKAQAMARECMNSGYTKCGY